MKVNTVFSCLWITCIITACEKDAVITPKDYPFVMTMIPEVKESSVIFKAQILDAGTSGILKYGFVWGKHWDPNIDDNFVFLDPHIPGENFQYEIKSGLTDGEYYYVKAYILTSAYEVYGNNRIFISQGSSIPGITNFSPGHGSTGTKVNIYGSQFGVNPSALTVKFGSHEAVIDSANENKLVVIVPVVTENETVIISVESGGHVIYSADSFDIEFPWTRKADFPNMRLYGYGTFDMKGKIYLCGGAEFGSNVMMSSVWQYDPVTNIWTKKNDFPGDNRKNGIGFTANDQGYYGMGASVDDQHNTYFTDIWQYDDIADTWTLKTFYPDTAIIYQKTFVINNQVFIGPGLYWDGSFFYRGNDVWNYDPAQNSWHQKTDFPGAVQAYMTGIGSDTKGYLGLGPLSADLYEYDLTSDQWTELPYYPGGGTIFNASFFIDGQLYIGLGGTTNGNPQNDLWRFDPQQKSWSPMQSCPTSLQPFFSSTINHLGYTGYGYYNLSSEDDIYGRYVYQFDPAKN
jgi:N-acetylneuraminic acid mutarotase